MYDLCLCTTLILSHSWRNRRRHGMISLQRRCKKHHRNQLFSIKGGLLWKKEYPKSDFTRLRTGYLSSSFYRAAISLIMSSKMFRCVSRYPISPSPCQRSEPCFSLAVRERYGNRRKNGHNRLLSRVTAKKRKAIGVSL